MKIRKMMAVDKQEVFEMMRVFYNSPAVLTNGSDDIYLRDIEQCLNDNPYLEGYIFEDGQHIQGYAMVSKSFSTEYGRPCVWVEDLYIKADYRGQKIGSQFLGYLAQMYPNTVLKLEVEEENEKAMHVYEKCGYEVLHYLIMKKNNF